ncbi:unnamed protein product [Didymodactylos carnosus]|uniref:Uncharacterized protein n=1 Tax=Didymodactylos carnosus TaxID=1234261 RepID=A0A813SZL6_9BILA|nr:unnamed protein product [Didymodactylos carnosus]CAF3590173.1 unnamed protein product [Didymodactylos carnosus]
MNIFSFYFLCVFVYYPLNALQNQTNHKKQNLVKQAQLYDRADDSNNKFDAGQLILANDGNINSVEGSGQEGSSNLDEDYEDDETLFKTTTVSRNRYNLTTTAVKISSTTTNKWTKSTMKTVNNSNDGDDEFKEEDYDDQDHSEDDEADYYEGEKTLSSKMSTTSYIMKTTTSNNHVVHHTPIWVLFSFLTRPPIAAGILCGEKSFSSYTTGLLYPNQYGYSKSPQEFYA